MMASETVAGIVSTVNTVIGMVWFFGLTAILAVLTEFYTAHKNTAEAVEVYCFVGLVLCAASYIALVGLLLIGVLGNVLCLIFG